MDDNSQKPRAKEVIFRLLPEHIQHIDDLAERLGTSRNQAIKIIILEWAGVKRML